MEACEGVCLHSGMRHEVAIAAIKLAISNKCSLGGSEWVLHSQVNMFIRMTNMRRIND